MLNNLATILHNFVRKFLKLTRVSNANTTILNGVICKSDFEVLTSGDFDL